ncbi:UNVERIFIED_CONTAM: Salicylate carboxymethyltransferase [Sesamum radiatum]|uniref:Salicylate carboxymethyltransferase n=1 Tax=Sesamum radiatum TaxID=300843 RepID=A0AAW2IMX0_SESRA
MNGGVGEASYANNSLVQHGLAAKSLCMAKLVAMEFVKIVSRLCRKHGHDQLPQFQIQLNDFPGNDFNSIFKSFAPSFHAQLLQEVGSAAPYCFLSGVPGSFYGRVFGAKSLHFVHSSSSLVWLSKVINKITNY